MSAAGAAHALRCRVVFARAHPDRPRLLRISIQLPIAALGISGQGALLRCLYTTHSRHRGAEACSHDPCRPRSSCRSLNSLRRCMPATPGGYCRCFAASSSPRADAPSPLGFVPPDSATTTNATTISSAPSGTRPASSLPCCFGGSPKSSLPANASSSVSTIHRPSVMDRPSRGPVSTTTPRTRRPEVPLRLQLGDDHLAGPPPAFGDDRLALARPALGPRQGCRLTDVSLPASRQPTPGEMDYGVGHV